MHDGDGTGLIGHDAPTMVRIIDGDRPCASVAAVRNRGASRRTPGTSHSAPSAGAPCSAPTRGDQRLPRLVGARGDNARARREAPAAGPVRPAIAELMHVAGRHHFFRAGSARRCFRTSTASSTVFAADAHLR